MNPHLDEMTVVRKSIGHDKLETRQEVQVFPGGADNPDRVLFVVLLAWYDGPLCGIADFRERKKEAASMCGWMTNKDERSIDEHRREDYIMEPAAEDQADSKSTWAYFCKFAEYQGHMGYTAAIKVQALFDRALMHPAALAAPTAEAKDVVLMQTHLMNSARLLTSVYNDAYAAMKAVEEVKEIAQQSYRDNEAGGHDRSDAVI